MPDTQCFYFLKCQTLHYCTFKSQIKSELHFFQLQIKSNAFVFKENDREVFLGQFHQRSMGSFYVRKLRAQLLLCLPFRFVLYWRKTVGEKAAHRTLVKLTLGRLVIGECIYVRVVRGVLMPEGHIQLTTPYL
jgi:hypothetical protein